MDRNMTVTATGAVPLVEVENLRVSYASSRGLARSGAAVLAVDGVSFSIRAGETLGLVGGTGSGKSTIAQVIMGMVAPTSGVVRIAGHALGTAGRRSESEIHSLRQVVLQDPYSSLNPRMRVGDIIAEPLVRGGRSLRSGARRQVRERVVSLLALVGLSADKMDLYPHQFSGGQRQRIAIARALAPDPALVVLDEPTSALDVSVRAQILTLLKRLQTELGVTYLVISHDLVTVTYLASTIAVMHRGRIVERGPTMDLYRGPRHPYTLELIDSAPGATGAFLTKERPTESRDELPPGACGYAYRCPLRTLLGQPAKCVEEDPQLRADGGDHAAACHFADETTRIRAH